MHVLAMIESWELLLVVVLIALVFGSSKIPDLARSLGKAKSEFHRGINEVAEDSDTKPAAEKSEAGEGPSSSPT